MGKRTDKTEQVLERTLLTIFRRTAWTTIGLETMEGLLFDGIFSTELMGLQFSLRNESPNTPDTDSKTLGSLYSRKKFHVEHHHTQSYMPSTA